MLTRSASTTDETLRDTIEQAGDDLLGVFAMVTAGSGLDAEEIAEVLDVPATGAVELVEQARQARVDAVRSVPLIRDRLGERRFLAVLHAFLTARLRTDSLRPAQAIRLAELGVRDDALATALVRLADSALDPAIAASAYAAAILAGADPATVAARRCETAARTGDDDTAMAIVEQLLAAADTDPEDRRTAVRVGATIWASRGVLRRSADLYRWLGSDSSADAALAATVLYGAGDPRGAETMLKAPTVGPPTDAMAADRCLAEAMRHTITTNARPALSSVFRALAMQSGAVARRLTPHSTAAIAALLSVHNGDLSRAQAALQRATETDAPGSRTWAFHRLLAGWVAMLAGDDESAAAVLREVGVDALSRHDELFARAMAIGLARRSGDYGALTQHWQAAHLLIDEVSIDLFTLLPLGELWLGGIRVGESERVEHLITEAENLLAALGDPPAWANTFHWYGVQAAIVAEAPQLLVKHAGSLRRAAEQSDGNEYAAALANAGRTWLQVLSDQIDPERVERSARLLARLGLAWDGARLAGEAALRATDTATATGLLQVARSLRQSQLRRTPEPAKTPPSSDALSAREAEVAELVVLGFTYREIGERLYISAKTVEHHVARIRRRLGAGSRSELLSMLRAMGYGSSP
ncbi:LuxR C-terminal-related transcriptional regulator [Skermania sp. ID1734]|uniref:LuxR C-terminal-related transcriptional regulator n=1 Tax=Skermania sp. ID1734 TaxID=2597516 RepID=UPI00163DAB17|nr:LuxR C-terminal-related transcriptional regulator [Skermania sp. ID1734]